MFKFIALLSLLIIVSISLVEPKCPKVCHNGGSCESTGEETEDWCDCPTKVFTGRDCSELACGIGEGPDEYGKCQCDGTGFNEIDCLGCLNDYACNVLMNTTEKIRHDYYPYRCSSNSLIPKRDKRFFCGSDELTTGIIGPNVTFECTNISNVQEGMQPGSVCLFQSWAFDIPVPLVPLPGYQQQIMDCQFTDCQWEQVKTNSELHFACKSSNCTCVVKDWHWPESQSEGMYCDNIYVKDQIAMISGPSTVICKATNPEAKPEDADYKDCTLYQSALKAFNFPLINCRGSECYVGNTTHFDPTDSESLWWVGLLISGIMGVFIILSIAISIVLSVIHTYRANKEYRVLQHKKFGAKLEFRNLSYWLKVKAGPMQRKCQILHSLTHTVYPGQVLAIMGASGAGKTTCLDILANRNKRGTISGERLLNGKPYKQSFTRFAGYVSQDDCLMGTLTVQESLQFAADVKLPTAISRAEKKKIVLDLLHKLKIYHIKDRKIGGHLSRGISGGERRRVAIAMELVGDPHILFLDEPTSGLDSSSAFTVINELVTLAKTEGKTIIFSIHQPRSNIFALFDELLLLSQGKICFAGPAKLAEPYFNTLGHKFPEKANVADSLIDLLVHAETENYSLDFEPDRLESIVQKASNYGSIKSTTEPKIVQYSQDSMQSIQDSGNEKLPLISFNSREIVDEYFSGDLLKHGTSFYTQLYALSIRAFRNFLRNWLLFPAHYASSILIGLLLGAVYWQQGNNLISIQNRLGSMFFMLSVLSFTSMSSLELFISERAIYVTERANGYYTGLAYFFSKILFDIIPLRTFPAAIMGAIAYYMIGLRGEFEHFLWFELILVLFNIFSGALCFCIAAIAPNVGFANVVTIVLTLGTSLFGGFLLSLPGLPNWISWVHFLSPYYYACEALFCNDLSGLPIIIDPQATTIRIHGTGEFVLNQLGMKISRFAIDVSVIGSLAVIMTLLAAILLILFVKEKR